MVTVEEARRLIRSILPPPREEELVLFKALGRVAAQPIVSALALPVFNNSAMDGFALRAADCEGASEKEPKKLKIVADILAGDAPSVLRAGESKRIMTGAPLPASADSVIAVEEATVKGQSLIFQQPMRVGRNVRLAGEEIKLGDRILDAGDVIHPGVIGFLAGLGVGHVRVYRKPKVAVVSTGSELVDVGRPLGPGKIYDSNGPMLRAALEEAGAPVVSVRRVQDRPLAIRLALAAALSRADVVLISGGVAGGQADLAKDVLKKLGVETVLWGVSQKPGKPFYVGRKGSTIVFGLPGNPASVFTCFYEYVYPVLRQLMGFSGQELQSERLPLTTAFEVAASKSLFLKARRRNTQKPSVELLPGQASHMLSSLRQADSLVVIPQGSEPLPAGAEVLVHALPYARYSL